MSETIGPYGCCIDSWLCTGCGQYVPYGETHVCPNSQGTATPVYQYPYWYPYYDPEVATQLKRIGDLLEELIKVVR